MIPAMFRLLLLLALFIGTHALPRIIRREVSAKQRQKHVLATDANRRSLVAGQLDGSPLPGSPTELVVFIAGILPNGKQMQMASQNGNSVATFSDDFDERAQWKITDNGQGRVRIFNMQDQTYLKDAGSVAIHGSFPDSEWTLKPDILGFVKITSVTSGRRLRAFDSQKVEIAEDDKGTSFVFRLCLKDVTWGGVQPTWAQLTRLNVYLASPHGGQVIVDPNDGGVYTSLHIGTDYDSNTEWTMGSTGEGHVLIQGPRQGFLGEIEVGFKKKLAINASMPNFLYSNPSIMWSLIYKDMGQVVLKSSLSRKLLERDINGVPRIADQVTDDGKTSFKDLSDQLWYVVVHSISW